MPTGLTITAGSPFATAASTSCSAAALLVEYGSVRAGGPSGCSATSPVASITAALLLVCTNRGDAGRGGGGQHRPGCPRR